MKFSSLALVILLMSLSCLPALAVEPNMKTVTAQGTGSVTVPADLIEFDLSVESMATEAESSSRANASRMKQVLATIKKTLADPEISTLNYQVIPQWSQRPRNPAPDWRPSITGYKTINTVRITTKEMEAAPALLAKIIDSGADTVSNLRFNLSDRLKYRQQVIQMAVKQAQSEAVAACSAVHKTCVEIVEIDIVPEDNPVIPRPMRAMALAEAAPSPPIESGDITVSASVRVVAEILPKVP